MSTRSRTIVRFDGSQRPTDDDLTQTSRASRSSNRPSNRNRNTDDLDVNQVEDEDLDRIVSNGVKYLLIFEHKKVAINRSDLLKAISRNSTNRKNNELIIEKIKSSLQKSFGLDLIECPKSPICYILVNKLSLKDINKCTESDSVSEKQHYRSALLSVILSHIFMSGQTIHEDIMWKFLEKIGLDVNSKQTLHINEQTSGITLKKLMTELWVKQLYLVYEKIPRSDPTAHEFKWGFRAEQELDKLDIIKFVCAVYGDGCQLNTWREQYKTALKETNHRNEDEEDITIIE